MPQVAGVLIEQWRAAVAGLLPDRPHGELDHRADERGEHDGRTRAGRNDGAPAGEPAALEARTRAAGLSESRAPASDPFEPDREQREGEHHRGELAGRVAVVRAAPDPEHADRHGVDPEVLHRGEVGERLHHHDRAPGGDRRTDQREHDAAGGLGRSRAERACGVVGPGRLVAQRGACQQVHVRVEHEREGDDRASERLDVGEPGVEAEPRPPRCPGSGRSDRTWTA